MPTATQNILELFTDINVNGKQENTKKLTTVITPLQNAYPQFQKETLIAHANENKNIEFLRDGVVSVLDTTEKIVDVINKLALFEFRRKNALISDLHTGIYTMLTRGEKFLDIKPIYSDNKLTAIRIYTTLETIYKATYGVLVNDEGRAIFGAGDIIHNARKVLHPILDGNIAMPRATASLDIKQNDGSHKKAFISGEPLHIYRATRNLNNIIVLDLDAEFTPLKISGDKITADAQYIHSIAGLTVFLQLGRNLIHKEFEEKGQIEKGIEVMTARRIINAIQTGVEIGQITGFGVQKIKGGKKLNVTLRRKGIHNIIPEAVTSPGQPTERINWKETSRAVALAGKYYRKAIETTGIIDDIQDKNIYIPATDKGAEFPEGKDYEKIVYLKAERASGNLINISYNFWNDVTPESVMNAKDGY